MTDDPAAAITPPDPVELRRHLAYAEASVLLIECLMQLLVQNSLLSRAALVDGIEAAMDTKRELIAANAHPQISTVAHGILAQIANSLAASREIHDQ
jgi:hypothetical protein